MITSTSWLMSVRQLCEGVEAVARYAKSTGQRIASVPNSMTVRAASVTEPDRLG
jgi:hypothetical protein